MDQLSHDSYGPPLQRAHAHAVRWLESLESRPVPAVAGAAWNRLGLGARDLDAVVAAFERDLHAAQEAGGV